MTCSDFSKLRLSLSFLFDLDFFLYVVRRVGVLVKNDGPVSVMQARTIVISRTSVSGQLTFSTTAFHAQVN